MEAAAQYRIHLQRRPGDAGIWVQLGHVLKQAGRWPEALASYQRALELDPLNAEIYRHHAQVLAMLGDLHGAEHGYRESCRLHPDPATEAELAAILAVSQPVEGASVASRYLPCQIGSIDVVEGNVVRGWAVDFDEPGRPAQIAFWHDGHVIGEAMTGLPRPDVAALGYGTTLAGFEMALPLDPESAKPFRIHAILKRSAEALNGSPVTVTAFAPAMLSSPATVPPVVRATIVKPVSIPAGSRASIIIAHAIHGILPPALVALMAMLARQNTHAVVLAVTDQPLELPDAIVAMSAGVIVNEAGPSDWAIVGELLRAAPQVFDAETLVVVDDGVLASIDALADLFKRLLASSADIAQAGDPAFGRLGFIRLRSSVLESPAMLRFWTDARISGSPADAGNKLAALAQDNHWSVDRLPAPRPDPAREEQAALMRRLGVGITPRFALLGLAQATEAGDASQGTGADRLNVSVYGPWNFNNGLGEAGRGLIAALRTTGARLNLHPVQKPFHIHRPITLPLDMREFDGPADVAIVHLNPDSWAVLTAGQRVEIERARVRIGYWFWEMTELPAAWIDQIGAVDRIWAPSRFCADLFARSTTQPIDVVPCAVPVPDPASMLANPAGMMERLGLAADRRIILYVFDGSSYLVRKNPHALVRAFGSSDLADAGWSLVIKTKHLSASEHQALDLLALANRVPGVILIDQLWSGDEMAELLAAATIYASPHCAEGFGLTIAEAMAAGKHVIATDFGGSADFLDGGCGYPVPGAQHRLDGDFGHYSQGGEWVMIDESALTAALLAAADAVARGDDRRPVKARARVADLLSYVAVGECARASLAAAFRAATHNEPDDQALVKPMALGIAIGQADLGPAVRWYRPGDSVDAPSADRPSEEWLVIAADDVVVSPDFAVIFAAHVHRQPSLELVYADDVAIGMGNVSDQIRCKPDWDVTLFAAQDYIGAPVIIRTEVLARLQGLRSDLGAAATYDLVLRAWGAGVAIGRIPEILFGVPGLRPVVAASARKALLEAVPLLQPFDVLPGLTTETLQLRRRFDTASTPTVTIIVDLGDEGGSRTLDGLIPAGWPSDRLRFLIGVPSARASLPRLPRGIEIDKLVLTKGLSPAARKNALWRAATTDHIVMVSSHLANPDADWLAALMTFAVDRDVGGVAPLIIDQQGRVCHAGIAGGFRCVADESDGIQRLWQGRDDVAGTYQDWAASHRSWSMVSGAVFATRRSILDRVGGFDESFAGDLADLDLCWRLHANGLRTIYTPHARFVAAPTLAPINPAPNSASDRAAFARRWADWIDRDPSSNPRLTLAGCGIVPGFGSDEWFAENYYPNETS